MCDLERSPQGPVLYVRLVSTVMEVCGVPVGTCWLTPACPPPVSELWAGGRMCRFWLLAISLPSKEVMPISLGRGG